MPSVDPGAGGKGEIAIEGEAEAIGLPHQRIVGREMQPVTAEIEGHAGGEVLGIGTAADAVRRLDQAIGQAGRAVIARGGDAGRPAARR